MNSADGQGGSEQNSETQGIEIDERFKHLDPEEGRLRTLQSRADSLLTKEKQYLKQINQLSNNVDVLQKLAKDKATAKAFLSKYHQDLIPNTDPYAEAESILKQEFGEDFVPDRDDANRNPFGKNGRYYDRVDELT